MNSNNNNSGSGSGKNNKNGFTRMDSATQEPPKPPSVPPNNSSADSETINVQNIHINIEEPANQQNNSPGAEMGVWPIVNDQNNAQYSIVTDNSMQQPQMATMRVDNVTQESSSATFTQGYVNYALHQSNEMSNDGTQFSFAPNIIFSFQPTSHEEMPQMMGNVMAIQAQQPQPIAMSYVSQTQPWIGHMNQISQMDPRSAYTVRMPERQERSVKNLPSENGDKKYQKPVFSYSCLIALALKNSKNGSLPVNEIYKYMQENFPYFKTAPDGWKNSVRHNLSLNKAFQKNVRSDSSSTQRKGCLWSLKPDKRRTIEKEIKKWFKKHPEPIRSSMTNPDNFRNYFYPHTADSGDEHSGSPLRDDIIIERQDQYTIQTVQSMEQAAININQIPFYSTGIPQNPNEAMGQPDHFDANLNTFFGDFSPSNWNNFSRSNRNNEESDEDDYEMDVPFNSFRNPRNARR